MYEYKVSMQRKTVVYNEGEDPKFVYLVRSGEVVCTKKILIPRPQLESQEIFLDDQNHINVVDKGMIEKEIEICRLGPGQIFGEQEAWECYKFDKERDRKKEKMK